MEWLVVVVAKDLLLLQSVIRTPANADVDILVRQATRGAMRETLKEIDKRGFTNIFVHLSVDDTYHLLRAVSSTVDAQTPLVSICCGLHICDTTKK